MLTGSFAINGTGIGFGKTMPGNLLNGRAGDDVLMGGVETLLGGDGDDGVDAKPAPTS